MLGGTVLDTWRGSTRCSGNTEEGAPISGLTNNMPQSYYSQSLPHHAQLKRQHLKVYTGGVEAHEGHLSPTDSGRLQCFPGYTRNLRGVISGVNSVASPRGLPGFAPSQVPPNSTTHLGNDTSSRNHNYGRIQDLYLVVAVENNLPIF